MNTQTASAGTNYAGPASTVNMDVTTGIRYGVISQHEVLQAWADSSNPVYPKPSEIDDIECPGCGFLFHADDSAEWGDTVTCPGNPAHEFELGENMELEAQGYDLNDGEYVAYAGDDGNIFVISSPYYTYAHFCSPCAPGACSLMSPFRLPKEYKETSLALQQISPLTDGDLYKTLAEAAGFQKAYCFDFSWFDNEKAPYRVFNVLTNEEVHP